MAVADGDACPPPSRSVIVDGRRIVYREAGSGSPPLLLLHGIGSGAGSWGPQLAALFDRLRLVAWDAPGYGESEPLPDEAPDADAYAEAAAGLLDALGIARCILLGHSLGAIMAAALVRRWPERVERLILSAPAAGYGRLPEADQLARVQPRLDDMATLGPAGLAAKRAPNLLSPTPPALALMQVRSVMARLTPGGYAQACRMLAGADLFADLPAVKVPTLVLCGSADRVTPEAGCRAVAEAIPGARYETLPGVGHASNVEDPPLFNAALRRFLFE